MRGGVFPDWITEDVFKLRCCEMYGCLPSELDGEDWHTVLRHRAIKAAEAQYHKADAKANAAYEKVRHRGR